MFPIMGAFAKPSQNTEEGVRAKEAACKKLTVEYVVGVAKFNNLSAEVCSALKDEVGRQYDKDLEGIKFLKEKGWKSGPIFAALTMSGIGKCVGLILRAHFDLINRN